MYLSELNRHMKSVDVVLSSNQIVFKSTGALVLINIRKTPNMVKKNLKEARMAKKISENF